MHHFWELLAQWGPLGVFVIALVDSLGVPNPGLVDGALILSAIASPANAWLCAALAVLGSLLGTLGCSSKFSRRGGERYLVRFTSSGRGLTFREWFRRYGLVTVFIPALLPVPFLPFKAFAACAAAMGVSRTRFVLVVLAAAESPAISRWSIWAQRSAKIPPRGSPDICGTWASSPQLYSSCSFCWSIFRREPPPNRSFDRLETAATTRLHRHLTR